MNPEKNVCMSVKLLTNAIRRNLPAPDGDGAATGMHGWLIGYLYENSDKDIYQRDIETKFNIRRSTATGILKLMEKNGLIIRQAASHDARLKKIMLTEKAAAIHRQVIKNIAAAEEKIVRGISAEELELFFSLIARMKKNIDDK